MLEEGGGRVGPKVPLDDLMMMEIQSQRLISDDFVDF